MDLNDSTASVPQEEAELARELFRVARDIENTGDFSVDEDQFVEFFAAKLAALLTYQIAGLRELWEKWEREAGSYDGGMKQRCARELKSLIEKWRAGG